MQRSCLLGGRERHHHLQFIQENQNCKFRGMCFLCPLNASCSPYSNILVFCGPSPHPPRGWRLRLQVLLAVHGCSLPMPVHLSGQPSAQLAKAECSAAACWEGGSGIITCSSFRRIKIYFWYSNNIGNTVRQKPFCEKVKSVYGRCHRIGSTSEYCSSFSRRQSKAFLHPALGILLRTLVTNIRY